MLPYNKSLKGTARKLRENMTDAERVIWSKVRSKQLNGYQFYRQKILGNYIVDFYCPKAKLVIEIDGGQHYSENGKESDRVRHSFIEAQGLMVLRFSDRDVFKKLDSVLEKIWENL